MQTVGRADLLEQDVQLETSLTLAVDHFRSHVTRLSADQTWLQAEVEQL